MRLEAIGLGKRYDKEWVLDGIDWELQPSTIYSVTGLNGAGKTTLLSLLSGLYVASKGDVYADGQPLRRESIEARKNLMLIPDFPIMSGNWTLYRHLATLLMLYEQSPNHALACFEDLVSELDLKKVITKPLGKMSRGQIYKSALLCLKIINPRYWLLDEPFASGADAHGISVMRRWFKEARDGGRTIVFTTQMPEIALSSADQVVLLNKQRCQFYRIQDAKALDPSGATINLDKEMESIRCED